jgi:hypothetical protein
MTAFKRGIRKRKLIDALITNDFWKAINNDPDLFVGIRNNYINAYYNGNNVCKIRYNPAQKRLIGDVHHKYLKLEKPAGSYYVDLFREPISDYNMVISGIKKTSEDYAGVEKTGVHSVCMNDDNVLDVEIAFSRINPEAIHGRTGRLDRLDYVKLEIQNSKPMLVFYEAKKFSSPEIKARKTPRVFAQMHGYTDTLRGHAAEIIQSYNQVCDNIRELGIKRKGSSIGMVHDTLTLDNIDYMPRLIIFGHNKSKERPSWKGHCEKLRREMGERLIIVED